jgi:hypothetical protein
MLWVEDSFRHAAGKMCIAAVRVEIGRVTRRPGAPLPARIHDEVGVACACPEQPVSGKTPPTAVADVLYNTGQLAGALARKEQPAFNGLPAKASEGDIEGFLRDQAIIHSFEGRVEWICPRCPQCELPE